MYEPENKKHAADGITDSVFDTTPSYPADETTSAANASDFVGTGEAPVNRVTDADERMPEQEARVDGEYHFPAKEQPEPSFEMPQRQAYSDAGYIPTESAGAVPPRYRYASAPAAPKEKKKKERRGISAAAVVALCLVCAILGGLGGGALAGVIMDRSDEGAVNAESADTQGGTVINKVVTDTTPVVTTFVPAGQELSPSQIYALACAQTVAITSEITYTNYFGYSTSAAVSGSGFIISSNGYILTNQHVIEDAAAGGYEITVLTYDGTEYPASVVGYEADNDVAVLKIDAEGLSPVTLGNSDAITVGEAVYPVGNPLGELQFSMSDGMVSALDRDISSTDEEGIVTTINMFQTTAAINSGNSGGPIYNSRGEVIGIATAKYADTGVEGLGFAIPINDAMAIANDLMTKGYVSGKAYMGVSTLTVNATMARYYNMVEGAYVYSVVADSCADTAGLLERDIITAIDGTAITTHTELISLKKDYRAGDSAVLTVWRNGETLELTIVFDEEVPGTDEEVEASIAENEAQGEQAPQMPGNYYYDNGSIFDYFFPFGNH